MRRSVYPLKQLSRRNNLVKIPVYLSDGLTIGCSPPDGAYTATLAALRFGNGDVAILDDFDRSVRIAAAGHTGHCFFDYIGFGGH
jgi:hypothetical protein